MKLTNIPQRVRVNIQSSHDPQHHLNWKVGIAIAEPNTPETARVFFTEGDLISTQIFTRYLHPC